MKITKRHLKRIIKEERHRILEMNDEFHLEPEHWDIAPNPEFGNAPCPIQVASAIRESGASDSDVINWLHALTMELTSGAQTTAPIEDLEVGYTMEAL